MSDFNRSSRESPGPRDWILDIYGSFVREFGGWIAVADLLELLQLVDVPAPSGRSALSRMKRRDELQPVKRGSQRGYSLTDAAEQWFRDGTARIMEGPPEADEDKWLLASFTVPEESRSIRYHIRSRLQGLGFGQVSGGLMIAPSNLLDDAVRAISRANFTDYVALWQSDYLGFGELCDVVAGAWDLDAILAAYQTYLDFAEELRAMPAPEDDTESFLRYLRNTNAWRELPFLDPGIPLKYLPEGWPSLEARAQFSAVADELRPAAWRHFIQVTSATGDAALDPVNR